MCLPKAHVMTFTCACIREANSPPHLTSKEVSIWAVRQRVALELVVVHLKH